MSKSDRDQLGKGAMTKQEAEEKYEAKAEKEIQNDIVAYLGQREIFVVRSRFGRRTTTNCGTPDLLFAYKEIPFAWELKATEGALQPEQERASIMMLRNGWRWSIVRSVQQAKEILDSI